jgi:tetratricopeptide (TPR) repeat protein/tRNA A-37 threonylcarbamoyl transferase component Bud32
MSPELQSARSIFLAAVEELPGEARTKYIDSVCAGDESLRQAVQRLVDAYGNLHSFMEQPAAGAAPTIDHKPNEHVGSTIDRYKLLEQIGEGGMGVVYVAEQSEPVRRRVALKIIKPGMDTRQVIARFEAERQALALMDHPNIARVYDAGATEAGRPYFVMELVRGMTITDYCDQSRQDVPGRLALFMTVCHAVQHAHQKGVIHRDIKPSNVLVTLHDGQPVVKVIDFGIAKAINQQLTERTIYTAFTELIGTPLYMSPEQAELSCLDVDTRSDVYSLGVLLYELLTGHTPFDREALAKSGLDEVRRMIREDEPPRPSHRISTLKADAASTVSQRRGIDQRQLSRQLSGELDWIVMKALEKDRNRRFESASAFAADLERYLNDEPVAAGPPSAIYRFRKFARRRRGVLTAISFVALALVAGAGISLWQAAEANAEREHALARLNVAHGLLTLIREELAVELARIPRASSLQRKILEESVKYYDVLLESDPDDSEIQFSRAVTVKSLSQVYLTTADSSLRAQGMDLLKEAMSAMESLCQADPKNLQKLRQLGRAYGDCAFQIEVSPGAHSASVLDLREKSAAIFRRIAAGEPDSEIARFEYAEAILPLAGYWRDELGRNPAGEQDPAKAVALCREAVELVEGLTVGEIPDKNRLSGLAASYLDLAKSLEANDNAAEAERFYGKSLDVREQLLKDEPTDAYRQAATQDANFSLAVFLRNQDRLAEEEPFFRRGVELMEGILAEHPDNSMVRLRLATWCWERIKFFQRTGLWREASASYPLYLKHLRTIWEERPSQFSSAFDYVRRCHDHANVLYELGDLDAAREAYRETLRGAQAMLAPLPEGPDNTASSTAIPFYLESKQTSQEEQTWQKLAWLTLIQSTCPFPELCDYNASLEIASRNSEDKWLQPGDESELDTDKFLFALALYRAGQPDKALLCLRRELTNSTTFFNEADRQLWRCRILADLGQLEEAHQAYQAAQAYEAEFPSRVDGPATGYLIRKRLFRQCAKILEERLGIDLAPAIPPRVSGGDAEAMD